GWAAINRGEAEPRISPQELDRAIQQAVRDLGRVQQALGSEGELSQDVRELIGEMQKLDPKRFPGNPQLLNGLHGRVLAEIEQVELRLRRMLDEQQGGNIRSTAGRPVPPGYAEAVAEYYRRLSRNP
ncbi:MAG TPA: hypothetical protein VN442_16410, partial [Bryobacteraceae bacterium]|nr:hypothetical protein [Bryobacteraceae bacterium]